MTTLTYGNNPKHDSTIGNNMETELAYHIANLDSLTNPGKELQIRQSNPVSGLYHLKSMDDVTAENIWKKIVEFNLSMNSPELIELAIGNRSEKQMHLLAVQYYARQLDKITKERKEKSSNRHAERTQMKVVKLLDPDYLKETHRESLHLLPMKHYK